ncbi:GntR family transcriptional regulator [Heyndrickxia shackletonii]|uniref:GntR family transcriptional regulator n=1 Tax=Heyndrickxia shackletonii TaxID=157838 RepID=UPI000A9B6AAA|nr:GntR family transcriptional regulator [Heyndrickxia shackletonii]NEZ01726.1 GntR family transcriptional regulator [Heyndrickxia shackletonii]
MTNEKSLSLKQRVYQHIKEAIFQRKMTPGFQLIETDISKQLQVSRTPIREAFQQLSKEGLVDMIPYRGAYIANPSHEEIKDICHARAVIESAAAGIAVEHITPKDIMLLQELVEKEELASYKKDIEQYLSINKQFHLSIVQKANNQYFNEFAETLLDKTNIYLIFYDHFFDQNNPLQIAESPDEHRRIIQLLKSREKEELQAELVKHTQVSQYMVRV